MLCITVKAMLIVLPVSLRPLVTMDQLRRPMTRARNTVVNAPMPPPSVAVNMPA